MTISRMSGRGPAVERGRPARPSRVTTHNEGPARTLEFQWSLQHPSSGDAEDFEIRGDRTAQWPVKLSRERAEYSRLMQQGYSNKEACRAVGINARTGRKWRNGRSADRRQKAAPPINAVVPPSGPSRYLSVADRIYIADRLREKATVRAIAAELGRSPSTISREIHRNRTAGARGQWHYRPHAAQARADARRPHLKPRKIGQDPELREFMQKRLGVGEAGAAQELHDVHVPVGEAKDGAVDVDAAAAGAGGRVVNRARRAGAASGASPPTSWGCSSQWAQTPITDAYTLDLCYL